MATFYIYIYIYIYFLCSWLLYFSYNEICYIALPENFIEKMKLRILLQTDVTLLSFLPSHLIFHSYKCFYYSPVIYIYLYIVGGGKVSVCFLNKNVILFINTAELHLIPFTLGSHILHIFQDRIFYSTKSK